MINRRQFLTHTATAGAGLAVGLRAFARDATPFMRTAGSLVAGTHLTPILLVDDAIRLTLLNQSISDEFKSALIEHHHFALASGALNREGKDVLALLSAIREGWAGRDCMEIDNHSVAGDMLEPKMAFAAGWLAQRAARTSIYGADAPATVDDRSIYHDVTLLHAIHDSEPVDPFTSGASVDELAQFLQLMYYRAYMRMHTIDPDFDDVEAWILRVVKKNREIEDLTRRYAEAYLNPDASKRRQYVEAPNFYAAADPIIELARMLQQGVTESSIRLADAVEASTSGSRYAQALGRAYSALESIDAYNSRVIAASELVQQLD